MLEYQGKYGKAKVMIDEIDEATVSQIYEFLNHPAFTGNIVIMPDTHAGNGAVIGFTMPLGEKVIPNVVGVDIGCGMLSLKTELRDLYKVDCEEIDKIIREAIPFGFSVRDGDSYGDLDDFNYDVTMVVLDFMRAYNKKFGTDYKSDMYPLSNHMMEWKCEQIGLDYNRYVNSIGTLGGGNHFIEIGKSEVDGSYWITIHSGSRQFGLKVAQYWQKQAGKGPLAYLEGEDAFNYLVDMVIAQKYAQLNRRYMADTIESNLGIDAEDFIETVHNFIDFNDFIIRKGAISSYEGQRMVIPFNMEDGMIICEGKSNPEWNYSAPHGAGRKGSRRWAKDNFSADVAGKRMRDKGIYSSNVPVDEVKEAYKDSQIIEDNIQETAKIIDRVLPVLNMKS